MFKFSKSKSINLARIYERAEDLINSVPIIERRRRRRRILKFLKYFFYSVIGLLLILIILGGSSFLNFKQVYNSALAGKNDLEYAVNSIKNKKFSQAVIFSREAKNNFNLSFNQLQTAKDNFIISRIAFFEQQINDLEYLIKTAGILSKAIEQGAIIGQELENILKNKIDSNFSELTQKEKSQILKLIYESSPELNGIKASLDLAYLNLDKMRYVGLFWVLEGKINKLKIQLGEGIELISKTISISEILPVLAGYPTKANFLILLQNNDELRPTGGFLGTYGILGVENGDIMRFDTHDIYHLDMPVKDKMNVVPPEPLKKYLGVDKWFMRDANWSPDWPTSAKKIEWFYYKQNSLLPLKNQINNFSGEFDGVIAIAPKLITDLLNIVGPIEIEGEEYNKDNFHRLLQYKVEAGYIQLGVPSWQRKEIIGQLAKELKIKLFDLPFSQWREIINVFDENILKKNILVWLKDAQSQNLIKNLNWAGEVKEVEGDYLMVVDANMASLKTDIVMNRNIEYKLEQDINGLFAKLKINYAHRGDFDWRTTRYRTYTRVYVPFGSKLIKAEGLTEGEVEIGNELEKSYFSAFISIEPGEIGSLYFEYKLPERLNKPGQEGGYSLYIQKQPGNDVDELVVDLKLGNEVKLYNPTGFYVERIGNNRIRWKTDLKMDRRFEVRF